MFVLKRASCAITIVGAGLMGRLLACALAEAGHSVHLIDAHGSDAQGAAARVAAAMLAPLAESAITEPNVVRMGVHGLRRWPELVAALPAPVFLQRAGTLIVWHRADAASAQQLHASLIANAQRIAEIPAPQSVYAAQIAELEPALAGGVLGQQGLFLRDEGQLDNRQLLAALHARLQALGVAMQWHCPVDLHHLPPHASGRTTELVLDCRGMGARAQWPSLRGVRGEVIRVHAPEVQLSRPVRLVHPRYPLYIAPKQDGHFVIGATQIEADDDSAVSVRSALELLSALYSVHSGFAEARIVEMASGLRPTLADNLPALRWVYSQGVPVLQINGLFRHGFMIAPAVLDAVLELLGTGRHLLAQGWEIPVQTDG